MYTQHKTLRAGYESQPGNLEAFLKPLEKGPTVRLLSQTSDHRVIFAGPGDDEPTSLPSHEFFLTHREAYPGEIDAYEAASSKRKAGAKEPAPAK